jgi:hypothetical protein
MDQKFVELKENLVKILEEADNLILTTFTFDLIDCIWSDIIEETDEELSIELVEAYAHEVESSLQIMNPELKEDVNTLEIVLSKLKICLESTQ